MSDLTKPSSALAQVRFVIGVAAGKGGVGKSSVALNLAIGFAKKGYRVGILDADIYGPSIAKMMGQGTFPRPHAQDPEMISPGVCWDIKWISAGHFQEENQSFTIRAPIATNIIEQFLYQVDWGCLDILLIDFPPGTGDIQITLAQKVSFSGIVLVTTPQDIALLDVKKALHQFLNFKIPMIGIIENMSYFQNPETKQKHYPFGQGGGEKLSQEFAIPLLGQIPLHPLISEFNDRCQSLFDHESNIKDVFISIIEKMNDFLQNQALASIAHTFELVWGSGNKIELTQNKSFSNQEILSIYQDDPLHFMIEWLDGKQSRIPLSKLQAGCPCMRCKQSKDMPFRKEEAVSAIRLYNYGRYALKVEFTSGCSRGVYPFSLLRDISS